MFHSNSGLYFGRNSDGSVTIVKTSDGMPVKADQSNVLFTQTVDDGTWGSIISTVSLGNESDGRWYAAMDFHNSKGTVAIVKVVYHIQQDIDAIKQFADEISRTRTEAGNAGTIDQPQSSKLTFCEALARLKQGDPHTRISRAGWNQNATWLRLYNPYLDKEFPTHEHGNALGFDSGTLMTWIGIRTADNQFFPWSPSQVDMLTDDWYELPASPTPSTVTADELKWTELENTSSQSVPFAPGIPVAR